MTEPKPAKHSNPWLYFGLTYLFDFSGLGGRVYLANR